MSKQRRSQLAVFLAVALLCRFAQADAYDPPEGYYPSVPGTGSTLKGQLYTIISTGFKSRSYGDARFAFATIDKDPANSNNILLDYNRLSVASTWDNGATYNREHVWPKSLLGLTSSQVGNSYSGIASDLFELRPTTTSVNGQRGNVGYGTVNVPLHPNNPPNNPPQGYGTITENGVDYWYPGDADRGDSARTIFYMATRYGQGQANNLTLVNGASYTYHFGDLASLLKWHYEDAPDNFERYRNQAIYSQALNPTYYQNNRNPYIDHPEWVWAAFVVDVDGNSIPNDSQITIGAPTTVDTTTGNSTKVVNLTNVIVGGVVPSAQTVALNKAGNNGTYYSVTKDGLATSSITGSLNTFRTNQADTKSINVGLDTNTVTAGLRTGTITINNLDITPGTNGGVGHAANDADDVITVNLKVLDHALPSFTAPSQSLSQTIDFGNIALGSSATPATIDIFNLNAPSGFTAALDLDNVASSGNTSAFTTDLASFTNLAAGASNAFTSSFNVTSVGSFLATYTLTLSDEDLSGATNKTLTLTLKGTARLAGDFNGDGSVDAGDYVVWQRSLGQSVAVAYADADGDGNLTVDNFDYDVWRAHFGQTASGFGSGSTLSVAVPEPVGITLLAIAAMLVCHYPRRFK